MLINLYNLPDWMCMDMMLKYYLLKAANRSTEMQYMCISSNKDINLNLMECGMYQNNSRKNRGSGLLILCAIAILLYTFSTELE